jgi:predicted ABC-type exoprotein transport system permease subunit
MGRWQARAQSATTQQSHTTKYINNDTMLFWLLYAHGSEFATHQRLKTLNTPG